MSDKEKTEAVIASCLVMVGELLSPDAVEKHISDAQLSELFMLVWFDPESGKTYFDYGRYVPGFGWRVPYGQLGAFYTAPLAVCPLLC